MGRHWEGLPEKGAFVNLLHPSQLGENLRQLAYVGFVDFFFYLCFEVKKEHYSCRRKGKASPMTDSRVDGIQKFQRIKKSMYIYIYLDHITCRSWRSRKQHQKTADT